MNPVSTALLAGGKSSRMGRDKCLLEIDGVPLWRRQLDLLATVSTDVMVVAPTPPSWLPPSARWIEDAARDHGPLAALAAALAAATHDRVLVLAVDLPGMTADYLSSLVAVAAPGRGVAPQIDGLFQPLSAIYPRAAHAAAAAHLHELDKSLQRLIRELIASKHMQSVPVAPSDRPLFRNLNSATD